MIRIRCGERGNPAVAGNIGGLRGRAQRGATMLAAAIGVFAVGVAMVIGVPAVRNSTRNARAAGIAAELRGFGRAFASHARQHGSWPPATQAPGEIPAGMAGKLGAKWAKRPATGFRYLWAPDSLQRGRRYRAAIVLWRDSRNPALDEQRFLEEIDRQLDDGDPLRGKFQLGYRNQAFFVLEP